MNRLAKPAKRLPVALVSLLLLVACGTVPTPLPSRILSAGEARYAAGPVLWLSDGDLVAVWVGADDAEVYQIARRLDGTSAPVILPLPPRHPFAQQGLPTLRGGLHLLWLDGSAGDSNRLFSALLTPDLRIERGPVSVSDRFTRNYALAPAVDGGVHIAWSGGLPAEPALYTQRIDPAGRPLQSERVALNADWPALARTGDRVRLYWLDRANGELWHADFDGTGAARLASGVVLAAGDRIVGVGAAASENSAAFYWQVTRASGSVESWLAGGPVSGDSWSGPVRLRADDDAVRWLTFAPGADASIAAAQVGQEVGLLALDGLRVTGFQALASLGADLIGPPRLIVPGSEQFAVSWAEPGPDAALLRAVQGP